MGVQQSTLRTAAYTAIGLGVGVLAYHFAITNRAEKEEEQDGGDTDRSVHDVVRDAYDKTIKSEEQGCCQVVNGVAGKRMGYSDKDLDAAGHSESTTMLGCGTPVDLAKLQLGETVLDLGCGAGIDCFIAAKRVGSRGSVIGIDMTPAMLTEARAKQKQLADKHKDSENGFAPISFRQGEIERLPVADSSVDCVISNCVLNLSPQKGQVYAEIFRVLKKGGRFAQSDVLKEVQNLPEHLKTDKALACWVAGASTFEEQRDLLESVGFVDVQIVKKPNSKDYIKEWMPGAGAEDYIVSADVTAVKPGSPTLPTPAPAAEEEDDCACW